MTMAITADLRIRRYARCRRSKPTITHWPTLLIAETVLRQKQRDHDLDSHRTQVYKADEQRVYSKRSQAPPHDARSEQSAGVRSVSRDERG